MKQTTKELITHELFTRRQIDGKNLTNNDEMLLSASSKATKKEMKPRLRCHYYISIFLFSLPFSMHGALQSLQNRKNNNYYYYY